MRIGFDAKRAFQNSTGLGHYSRTLIRSLAQYFPANEYFLFAPKKTNRFNTSASENIKTVYPQKFPFTILRSLWRSSAVKKDLLKNEIDIYHGLSHEIPFGLRRSGIRSVVTIHDLIFERFPGQYKKADIWIYRKKFKYACAHADAIIAISRQTRQDLIDFYKVPAEKITVCYQSCDPIFARQVAEEEKQKIRLLYELPERFFLSVGSIIERKNLLTICKALHLLKDKLPIPLVVIGDGKKYKEEVKQYLLARGMTSMVIFLSENEAAQNQEGFKTSAHFPAIYQMAEALIYPSVFEGFGIPVLEALFSRLPVITSSVSCMPEAGGDAAAYIQPFDHEALSLKMEAIAGNKALAELMKEKGWLHAQQFTTAKTATAVMNLYKKLMQ
jgi:glycosyltransferase involved in cell wall biosynthesis